MKYQRPGEIHKIRQGTFFVKFSFESIEECLGSYCTFDTNAKGHEVLVGYKTKALAMKAGKEIYKDDPEGPASFEVLDYQLRVVDSFSVIKEEQAS